MPEQQRPSEPKKNMLGPACAANRALAPPDLFEALVLSRTGKAAAPERIQERQICVE